ncbi:MAG: hypothetical protein HN742_39525 [Lentisphaerae bacterium]|jgi:hypothetical protein|nr:hypothetical protein [Lentisphaerota bacterium]MBT5612445.1 hypothetical protein [Lentisphaerota bacterium]MBT7057151.1 hypothetical protein [Lentisphaerota bacterium]MBT7848025.1 hypothetical protein [Lentisphaerota bacterium]
MRPHLFVTAKEIKGLRSVAAVRTAVKTGRAQTIWEELKRAADADAEADVLVPTSIVPGRPAAQAKAANPDWSVCHLTGQRLLRAALAQLITGSAAYRDSALRQMAALFDPLQWPDWRDKAHRHHEADLRTGMLGKDLAIAYDWLCPSLTDEQRRWVIEGIDRCAIQPFWRGIAAGSGWADGQNNWTTTIVGGLGIAGMALADAHPDSERLVEYALPRMAKYLETYGVEGEFNESVGYAGATRDPVLFLMAYWYATGGRENGLARPPFVKAAQWYMYFVLPPGRVAAFGDGTPGSPPDSTWFAPLAAANRDGVLQWFYLNHPPRGQQRDLPWMLLTPDPDVVPGSPQGKLPRGRAFRDHGAGISSRADWAPRSTPCAVYGKAAIEQFHAHHDAGQVCIDGYGKRLIVDLGSPPGGYPADFFDRIARYKYYNASSWGHNVLVIGGREMSTERGSAARFLATEFDDDRGGFWQLDLTTFYDGAQRVRRTVVHLHPAVVAVLDDVTLDRAEDVSLRWHTADRCEPDGDGRFCVAAGDVRLAARVVDFDGAGVAWARREHEYRAPYNRHRLGTLFRQPRESFVETTTHSNRVRLLSLFAVFAPGAAPAVWEATPAGWTIATADGPVEVQRTNTELVVRNRRTGTDWRVPDDR